ncbi:MAG: hypothetical protein ABIK96_00505 [bacterium]
MQFVPDVYTRRARLAPLLLTALPVGLATLAFFPQGFPNWGVVWGFVTWCGGIGLLAQLGRDAGKAQEAELFAEWGGPPTTVMLRHRSAANPIAVTHRHDVLSRLFPDLEIPSKDDELRAPENADHVYEQCVRQLRNLTRDHSAFPLVFDENCSYGFRRNLWGMKPFGLALTILAILVTGVVGWRSAQLAATSVIVSMALNLVLVCIWVLCVTRGWVRTAADAYAERLLEASDTLAG